MWLHNQELLLHLIQVKNSTDYQYSWNENKDLSPTFRWIQGDFSLVHVLEAAPPSYSEEYEDPKVVHPDKAPIYDNPTFTPPNDLGVNNNVYTGLPGKE